MAFTGVSREAVINENLDPELNKKKSVSRVLRLCKSHPDDVEIVILDPEESEKDSEE